MRSSVRSAPVPQRSTRPGATVDVVVLASGRRTTIGIDLSSGAFVRTSEPRRTRLLEPYTIIRGVSAPDPDTTERPDCPELVMFEAAPVVLDRLRGRSIERLVRPLLHPKTRPLLGFHGPSAPWWELHSGSVALVQPDRGPVLRFDGRGLRCTYHWGSLHHDLPMEDLRVLRRLDWLPPTPLGPQALAEELGFRPERLLVVLGRPRNGYCPKVVAGLLP